MFGINPKLKDVGNKVRKGSFAIELKPDNVKFELVGTYKDELEQTRPCSRVWINTNARTLKWENFEDSFKPKILLVKEPKKIGKILDSYEIHPSSYSLLIRTIQRHADKTNNPNWHITLKELKNKVEQDELVNFTIARFSGMEFPQDENQLPFVPGDVNTLLQISNFSTIELTGIKSINNREKNEIEAELSRLYLSEEEIDTIRDWLHIEDFSKGKKKYSKRSGVVFYGPPGTGKSFAASNVLRKVFKDILDFGFQERKISELMGGERSGIVAGFAHAMNQLFAELIEEIQLKRKPCICFIDEATDLLRKHSRSGDNGDKWLSEGAEILKNYLNPERYPGIFFVFCTNLTKREEFNDALFGQRLGTVLVPIPNYERWMQLWEDDRDETQGFMRILEKEGLTCFSEDRKNKRKILSEICADIITVRSISNLCENYPRRLNANQKNNFDTFKKFLINFAKEEAKAECEKNITEEAKFQDDVDYYKGLLSGQLAKLERIEEGMTEEEVRINAVRRGFAEVEDNIIEEEYKNIYEFLIKKVRELREKPTEIVNSDFLTELKNKNSLIIELIKNLNKEKIPKQKLDITLNNLRVISEYIEAFSGKDKIQNEDKDLIVSFIRTIHDLLSPDELFEGEERPGRAQQQRAFQSKSGEMILPGDPRYEDFMRRGRRE